MNKRLLIIICVVWVLASCTKDGNVVLPELSGEMTMITVGVDNGVITRAAYSDPALHDMRLVLTVSRNREVVYSEIIDHHNFTSVATFNVKLVSDQKYTVSCWADFGEEYYVVVDGSVAMNSTVASDNRRDAYFACKEVEFDSRERNPRTIRLTMTRPFGLVKINTTDYNTSAVKSSGMRPVSYSMRVSNCPISMSLIDGSIVDRSDIALTGSVSSDYDVDDDPKELSFDYLFAEDVRNHIDFDVDYATNGGELTYRFANIPIQRNYRSNISGNIITKAGGLNVDGSSVEINITNNADSDKIESIIR